MLTIIVYYVKTCVIKYIFIIVNFEMLPGASNDKQALLHTHTSVSYIKFQRFLMRRTGSLSVCNACMTARWPCIADGVNDLMLSYAVIFRIILTFIWDRGVVYTE